MSVARGIEGRPRRVRVIERSSCVAYLSTEQMVSSVAGSTGWEGKSVGRAREALMAGQHSPGWCSELRQAAVMPCSALRSGSREAEQRREKGGRERERELTLIFLKIFNGSLKKFEYESCSKFKILQLSFQAQTHLKPS